MKRRRFWMTTAAALALVTLCMGLMAHTYLARQIEDNAAEELVLLAELRKGALERYLKTAESELRFWATNLGLLDIYYSALADWESRKAEGIDPGLVARQAYIDDNPHPLHSRADLLDSGNGTEYDVQHLRAQPLMRLLLSERGYYDFFAITPDGDVLYTIQKEDDYGTNLLEGPYSESGLGEIFRRTLKAAPGEVLFTDIARYSPSAEAPAMFMATALFNDGGQLTGVWALQLPTERIVDVMRPSTGFGETGQIYVVGDDLLMRSDLRFSSDSAVLAVAADSATVRLALAGNSGVEFTRDYRGIDVLSAYAPIEVGGSTWAIMSEISQEELASWVAKDHEGWQGFLVLISGIALWSAWYVKRALPDDAPSEIGLGLAADVDVGQA